MSKMSKKIEEVINDLIASLNLSGKSESEIKELRSFLEGALTERISVFILKNLSGEKLSEYESIIDNKIIEPTMISNFLNESISNFEERLREDLLSFQQEVISKFNK